jgi:diaminopimelate epimerase
MKNKLLKPFSFHKYHGTGNDFIIVDNRQGHYMLTQKQIHALCDRHFGIGADGFISIENSIIADFKMVYYNADGNAGSMCGNGGRCAVAFAYATNIITAHTVFEAFDGLHTAKITSTNSNVSMIELGMADVSHWHINNNRLLIDTGSPHYVCRVEDLESLDILATARQIRYDKTISTDGVNVNLMEKKDTCYFLRTYERGVEKETLSCGTGATAAGIAAHLWFGGSSFDIKTLGGHLTVSLKKQGESFTEIMLYGPAEYVFKWTVDLPSH